MFASRNDSAAVRLQTAAYRPQCADTGAASSSGIKGSSLEPTCMMADPTLLARYWFLCALLQAPQLRPALAINDKELAVLRKQAAEAAARQRAASGHQLDALLGTQWWYTKSAPHQAASTEAMAVK